jgi:hypothetical protein
VLEVYICARCGFTDWYCRDPHTLPIGDEHGTELVDVTPREPYR